MKPQRAFASILLLLAPLAVAASAQTQLELNETSYKEWQKADEELNKTYKALLETLDDEGKKKLQVAQRAWIKFRDAECESQGDDHRGGSIVPLIHNSCACLLTEARTKQLKERFKP